MSNIDSITELRGLIGQEVKVSDWIQISQQRIQQFADATGDHQWIHLDQERCRRESPHASTIAHGFLTLALLPMMMGNLISLADARIGINYGLNKVRFTAPVPVLSRVRGRIKLLAMEDFSGGVQITWQVTIECEGSDKPVCFAESIMRQYT